jgi:type I restriction enzyme M protein
MVTTSKPASNQFCRISDLSNEASVEAFFVLRLLAHLGYRDDEIRAKESIEELKIPRGSRTEPYRPDFVLIGRDVPRWLIDAKAPTEHIENYTYQCAGYALQINRRLREKPLRYYLITNGLLTRVYIWDQDEAILSLRFSDFTPENHKFQTLVRLLSAESARRGWVDEATTPATGHRLIRPDMDTVKRAFAGCHRIIWKAEKMGKQGAFVEFAKILFVKLWEDRKLRDDPAMLEKIGRGDPLPPAAVRFSKEWIKAQEENDPNPINGILFRRLVETLEQEILLRKRKRIFDAGEQLDLAAGTARRVVGLLEKFYLFGIDEDLNGRMFEAFLAATMRGQDLGQYFTPRSVVKLVSRIAALHAGRDKVERVLDACCGTGGFLIEALTDMRQQIWDNQSLSDTERRELLNEIANEAIFGIDAGRDPMLARIARINMYLHGDGGSRVYATDSLRHPPEASAADSAEVRNDTNELRSLLQNGLAFDAVLSNPPFSMDYSVTVPEEKDVLETYELATYGGKRRTSLKSSVMFIERYWQLLKPGGRLITVIDDGVLGGKNFAPVRDFIRERFIVKAIISLHGDAFQRAGARVKTSIVYLVKRQPVAAEGQPAAFAFESRFIGLDDVTPKTRSSVADAARDNAAAEIDEIVHEFNRFLAGGTGPWLVPPERLGDRLDAKFLLPWSVGELLETWRDAGANMEPLEKLVDVVDEPVEIEPEARYTFLRVTYEGRAEVGEAALGHEISYSRVSRSTPGDIVVSNINAVNKAICVIPDDLAGLLISNEYTVLRLRKGVDADTLYLWSVLRSTAVVAEWISTASGVGRHRVDWESLRTQRIPLLPPDEQRTIGNLYRDAMAHESESRRIREHARSALAPLDLDSVAAQERLARAKPPK